MLVHDDVNLITVPPLGDIVSFRVTVTALSRFINNFMLHIGALNPGCHRCLPNQFECQYVGRSQRFERGAHGAVMIDPRGAHVTAEALAVP